MAELLHHFSHECPLTFPDIVANGVCNSCYKDEPVELACNSCKFDLCKLCSKLPQKVSHDFHEHDLQFCLREYDQKPAYIICSCCGNMSSGSFYECKACEIYLDLDCASQENIFRAWDAKEMLHYSHCHLLRRCRPGPDIRGSCLLCERSLSPSAICYGCVHCYSFIHERCLDLPLEIQHPVHPSHVIRRLDYTQTLGEGKNCDACGEIIISVPFGCLECRFNLHLRCADSLLRGLMHKSHEHMLFYVSSDAYRVFGEDSLCQICMKTDAVSLYSYYRCVECGLKFHFECLKIPEFVVKKSYHIHSLECTIFIAEDDSMEYCGVCETVVYAGHHAYSCKECDFLGHIECILREEVPSPLYLKNLYSFGDEDTNTIIIDQEDCNTNKLMVRGKEHVHELRPVDMSEVDQCAKCNICAREILGRPCKCETCNFQTHYYCAELGKPSRHRLHRSDHALIMLPEPPSRDTMSCDSCRQDINGFILFCRVCDFIVDISCALKGKDSLRVLGQKVIGTVRGRCIRDKHNMVEAIISSSYQIVCVICDDKMYGKALSCIKCNETYHHKCTENGRQRLLRNPLHSNHWLKISLIKGSKCTACRLKIANYGYKCSSTCCISFHVKCINASSLSGKIKSHSHNLYHFYNKVTRACSVCARTCDASFYGCIDCNFEAHGQCIGYPDSVKNEIHQHALEQKDLNGKKFCFRCKRECHNQKIYYCSHCEEVFHRECIMSLYHRGDAPEEEQLGDINGMRIDLENKSDILLFMKFGLKTNSELVTPISIICYLVIRSCFVPMDLGFVFFYCSVFQV